MSKDKKFLAYFDCEGFECLINISKHEDAMLLQTLKGEKVTDEIGLNSMILRARYNPQRSPEIWVFTSTVDEQTLQDLAKDEPQMLVDLIRKHGTSVWKNHPVKRVIE